jgi:glycosyltransferase involved in cell wall biosynthesis
MMEEAGADAQITWDRIAAVIPAYQEAKHVAEVVRRTLAHLNYVLVVDDGSPDETANVARQAGAEVIVHPVNRGKGETIKTGLHYWFERGMEFVVILDADGQHLPEEISRFVALATGPEQAKFIVGNRMNDVARMPAVRRFVNRYMSAQISRVCGQKIPDTQCGFRLLHRDLIPEMFGGAERFDYETEMLIFASRKGYRIDSVSITTVYSDEVSSIHPVRDTIRFFKLMQRQRQKQTLAPAAVPSP